jgi:hypothetical protein
MSWRPAWRFGPENPGLRRALQIGKLGKRCEMPENDEEKRLLPLWT